MHKNRVTRHLTDSICRERYFRNRIFSYVKDNKIRAFAPDTGIDLDTLIEISSLLRDRDFRYDTALLCSFLTSLLLSFSHYALGICIFLISSIAVQLVKYYEFTKKISPNITRQSFNHDTLKTYLNDRYKPSPLSRKPPSADSNIFYFSNYVPFIGAGHSLGGWSLPIDLGRSTDEDPKGPTPFTLQEMYSNIGDSLKVRLGESSCEITDCLFVDGGEIRDDKTLLPSIYNPPIDHLPKNEVLKFADRNDNHVRFYKWVKIPDWHHDIVISFFVRLSRIGSRLYIEVYRYLLSPLARTHRKMDKATPMTATRIAYEAFETALLAPFYGIASLRLPFESLYNTSYFEEKRTKKLNRHVDGDPTFNYGAPSHSSIRESECHRAYDYYFQMVDKEKIEKIFNEELISIIYDFLEEHKVDLSGFKEQSTTILNQGIIMSGGKVESKAIAVGREAKSIVSGE